MKHVAGVALPTEDHPKVIPPRAGECTTPPPTRCVELTIAPPAARGEWL